MTTRETALLVTLGVLALYSVQAQATGQQSPAYRVDVFQNSTTVSQATAAAAASARSTAGAVAVGGTSTSSATGGSATAQGGQGGHSAATVNVNTAPAQRRTTELRTVGIAPDMVSSPTAPCRVAMGIGGGPMGWAASIFGSTLDEGCEMREEARLLYNFGEKEAALRRLCKKKETAEALGCWNEEVTK